MYFKLNTQELTRQQINNIRKVFLYILGCLEFMFLLGIAGSVEIDKLSCYKGYLYLIGSLLVIGIVYCLFCLLFREGKC